MTNKAKITQGKDTFSGDRIEYNLDKDLVKAGGTGRIEFVIQPQSVRESQR